MILTQTKLDVTDKKRSNLFNWRGQFTPEFVEYLLQEFSKSGDFIFDPFSGSGTVLLEASKLNLKVTGFEINPAANIMSKFFIFCNLSVDERINFLNSFEEKLNFSLMNLNNQKTYIENANYRKAYKNLLDFGSEFYKLLNDKKQQILFLNILFKSEKDKNLTLKESLQKSFQYFKKNLLELHYSDQQIKAELKDARNADDLDGQVNLIITSPPYINVFNYHQNYRGIIELFNFDILKVAHSEFGSNRKNRGNRFKTVIQYCLDMELSIRSFWKALKPDGKIILIVGRESNVRSVPFYNSKMIINILECCCGFDNIKISERKFINKFGISIKEDIIIANRLSQLSSNLYGKNIAVKHLEVAMKLCNNDNPAIQDIKEAILSSDKVESSPFFDPKTIIK